jgi:hypothetical protein
MFSVSRFALLNMADICIFMIVVFSTIRTDCAENTIHLLLYNGRCLVIGGSRDSASHAFGEYATQYVKLLYNSDEMSVLSHGIAFRFKDDNFSSEIFRFIHCTLKFITYFARAHRWILP